MVKNIDELSTGDIVKVSYIDIFNGTNYIIYKRLFVVSNITETEFYGDWLEDLYVQEPLWTFDGDEDMLVWSTNFKSKEYIFERIGKSEDFPEYLI
jgi:hypothetical protein